MDNDFTMFLGGCFVGSIIIAAILSLAFDKYSSIETLKNKKCIIYKEEIYCKVGDDND